MDRINIQQIEQQLLNALRRAKPSMNQDQKAGSDQLNTPKEDSTFRWSRSFDSMATPFFQTEIYIISPYAPSPLQRKVNLGLN